MNDILSKLKIFDGVVGQEQAKKQLRFYLDSYMTRHIVPNFLITGPAGDGKTTLAKEIGRGLVLFGPDGKVVMDGKLPARKVFHEINCSSIDNLKQFINSTLIKYVVDKDATIFFDEASEIPQDVTQALLTILNPSPSNQNTFCYDTYVCPIDFTRQTFIFATSEPHKMFHALQQRLERISMENYTFDQLGQIIKRGLMPAKGKAVIQIEKGVIEEASTVVRGSGRDAQKMAGKLLAFLKNRTSLTMANWNEFKEILSIQPFGLNPLEIQILKFLSKHTDGVSLTALSSKTGMTKDALQKDVELFLMRNGLIEVRATGRCITAEGQVYLKSLA